MAFSLLEKTLATAVGLDILKPGTSRKAATAAAKALVGVAGRGAAIAAPRVSAAALNPVTLGAGLGLSALATPPGQSLLQAAAERGQSDRVRLQQMIDEFIFANTVLPFRENQSIIPQTAAAPVVDIRGNVRTQSLIRRPSQHNKDVKKAMKAVKNSKFSGPKGRISNIKATFGKVNKTISKIKKGQKVSRKGVTGVIARAIKR